MFNLNFLNYFLINILFIQLVTITFYKNKINFNNFYVISLSYLIIFFLNFLTVFFYKSKDFFLDFNIKFFFKPIYINIFSIKITFLENYFILVITLISFFSNLLTFFYLNDDKKKKKFFIFLNFFTLSMILFIIQNCIFLFIISWELLGLTSFFLINHYENSKSLKSSISAFLFNRISDIPVFIISFLMIINNKQKIEYIYLNFETNTIISICIVLASFFKSAVFFFKWLPDSMEAPLPASALIHSATLVSAGIYLNIKHHYFLQQTNILCFLQIITIILAIFFALIASYQTDIKKILAYSTIANCSFIYNLIFSKNLKLALIYFSLHGIFKSLVFIIFGYSIIIYKHKQDIRYWNNILNKNNKIIFLSFLPLSCLASLQITPVYFYKSLFLQNFTKNHHLYLFSLCFYYFYSIISLSYFLKIFKIIFFKKNIIKNNLKKIDFEFINNFNTSSVILYSIISFIFTYFICYNYNYNLEPNYNYLIITYIIPLVYLNNIKIFNKNTIFLILTFLILSFFF